jgi:hypothetical protein
MAAAERTKEAEVDPDLTRRVVKSTQYMEDDGHVTSEGVATSGRRRKAVSYGTR